ncbi:MAG TPA: hypothetical protein VM165_22735 [Planctomycetaceae bacterium]|nr:hypothetical protein [Planctomycetaceae bacterium]
MSQHDWEELLSAYADGEVTPAERIAAESLLETTPAARATLNEIRALSQSLHALPRESAPPEFRTAVQKATQSHVTPAAAAASRRFRSYRREWLAGFSAIAMTVLAAGLLSLQFRPESQLYMASPSAWYEDDVALAPMTAPLGGESLHRGSMEIRTAEFGTEADGLAATSFGAQPLTENEALLSRGMTRAAVPAASETARTSGGNFSFTVPTTAATPAVPLGAVDAPQPSRPELTKLESLTDLSMAPADIAEVDRLREVLPYLRLQSENGQVIGNYDLVVVDAQRVANQFQVLLMQNGVTTVDARTIDFDTDAAQADGRMAKKPAEAQDLFAVYAEAPGEPLSKTLEELIKQREVLSMKLQPPLQIGQADALDDSGEAKPADRKRNLKQITDAYVIQQWDDGLTDLSLEAVVSAADAIAVARGDAPAESRLYADAAADKERQKQWSAVREPPNRRARLTAKDETAPAKGLKAQSEKELAENESKQNLASFNTLVRLQVAAPTDDVNNNTLTNRYQSDVQQNFRRNMVTGNAPAATAEDFAQMRSRFGRTAQDTVRILFVLHPAPNQPTTAPASAPAR